DDTEGDAEGVADDGNTQIIPMGDDDAPPEFDDELPTDPSFDIDLPSEVETGEAEAPLDLPVGPDFAPVEEKAEALADDTFGFPDAAPPEQNPHEADEKREL